jgi:hypothetical protein
MTRSPMMNTWMESLPPLTGSIRRFPPLTSPCFNKTVPTLPTLPVIFRGRWVLSRGQPLDLGLGSVIAFGSAGQSVRGWGVHARRSAQVEMTPDISACDRNLLNEYARVVEQASLGSFPALERNLYL